MACHRRRRDRAEHRVRPDDVFKIGITMRTPEQAPLLLDPMPSTRGPGIHIPEQAGQTDDEVAEIERRHNDLVVMYGGEPWDESCVEDGEKAHKDRATLLTAIHALLARLAELEAERAEAWKAEADAYILGVEDSAALFESVSPASDSERLRGDPGAGAMGAVLEYRDKIRALLEIKPSPKPAQEV